ncbi:CBS domain-containing protein [Methanoplanus limicola]|uniref:CBS domain containing protein n=1 Tax=Methanoplanus limicola DSM 2279 TaxID=937775 RepID=H1YWA5_9EURY|nr:CBS domain-containing protein [Methanoplanus limicola]EHQ34827.1 CBS domain containing protein [Methanoplanus limicola DSM 2279]
MNEKTLVKDVMSRPVTIAKSAPITEALDKMLSEGADPLIVTNNGVVTGTISRKAIAETLGSKKTSSLPPTKIHVVNRTDDDFTSVYSDEEAQILIPLLQRYKIVVVLDEEHKPVGKVDATDLLKVMVPEGSIENLMQNPHSINPGERVVHLRRRMIDENSAKFVVTEEGNIVGVVTETDVAKSMKEFRETVGEKHQEQQVRNLYVSDIMTSPALTMDINGDVANAIDLIVSKNISSLPVIKDGKLVGIVSKESLIVAL